MDEPDDLPLRLAKNIKQLREARGLTQQQMAKLSEVPRATWAHLESGAANPTLSVLHRAALALQVSIEEMISAPRATAGALRARLASHAILGAGAGAQAPARSIPGMEIERMEIKSGGRMTGVPHTPGTREYLTCESGEMVLVVSGERWALSVGDVVVFRGDQRHSYHNPGVKVAVGYSVVVLARVG